MREPAILAGGRSKPRLHARNGPSPRHMIAVVDAFAPGGINDIRGAAEIRGEAEV